MDASPLVSVIVPTYDRPAMLKQAIDSALRQTYRNIEVIVSDDGTNPLTRTVAASTGDPRVRYRRNPENLGEIRNNQVAYREARGAYLANLHDDDLWTPRFLERLVPPLEAHQEASIAFCDHYIANPDGSFNLEHTELNTRRWGRDVLSAGLHRPFWREALLDESVPVAMASVIRASAFNPDDFRVEARASYDKWIAYLLCRNGQAAYYHPERLTAYRIHAGQESAKSSVNWAAGEVFCAEMWADDSRLSVIAPELRRLAHQKRVDLGKELLREGRTREARSHLVKSFRDGFSRTAPLLLLGLLPGSLACRAFQALDAVRIRKRECGEVFVPILSFSFFFPKRKA
jgi:glycosyltransferase involved in cell wall biosynthesis